MDKNITKGLWIIGILALISVILCAFVLLKPLAPGVTKDEVKIIVDEAIAGISVPVSGEVTVNLSGIEDRLVEIETTLNEENDWKDEAIALATGEWEERDYRAIYRAIDDLYDNIDEREDIEYVRIKDEEVTSPDVDDQDAVVIQNVKVKYEDKDGDDKKVYLTITTDIEENEIENQGIKETVSP